MTYMVIIDSHSDILDDFSKEYPCTNANAKFVEPRVLRMWKGKRDVKYIYRLMDGICDVLYGKVGA